MSGSDLIKLAFDNWPQGVALLGWAAWYWERRSHQETVDALRELSVASIEAHTKNESAINTNTRVMEQFLGRD